MSALPSSQEVQIQYMEAFNAGYSAGLERIETFVLLLLAVFIAQTLASRFQKMADDDSKGKRFASLVEEAGFALQFTLISFMTVTTFLPYLGAP